MFAADKNTIIMTPTKHQTPERHRDQLDVSMNNEVEEML